MMNIKALYHNMLLYRTCKGSFTYGHGWFIIFEYRCGKRIYFRRVQNLSVNQRIRRKDDDEESSDKKQQSEKEEEEFQDGLVEKNPEDLLEEEAEVDIEDIENPNKDFYVKLNVKDDIIELYDSATNRLIETISGNELGELVQKLNMASGIFVNKKV